MTRPSSQPASREIDAHGASLRRLARALLTDESAADDVVQEAWLARAGERREVRAPAAFLASLVRSLARRRRRGDARRRRREEAAARAEALPSAADTAARVEVARRVVEALERLPEPYRTTLVLRYFEDLSAADIARRAGLPASTVRARLKRGIERMRADLDSGVEGRGRALMALLLASPPAPLGRDAGSGAPPSTLALGPPTLTLMKLSTASLLVALLALLTWVAVDGRRVGRDAVNGPSADARGDAVAALEAVDSDAQRQRAGAAAVSASPAVASFPDSSGAGSDLTDVLVEARATTWSGAPISGARLSAQLIPEASASSGPDGRLQLRLAASALELLGQAEGGGRVAFAVEARGYTTSFVRSALAASERALHLGDVVLRPGAVVRGRVVDEAGLGVEGALVVLGAPPPVELDEDQLAARGPLELAPVTSVGMIPSHSTHSGVGGEFTIEGARTGYGLVWARTDTSRWAHSALFGLRPGDEVSDIVVAVRDAADDVISGRVLSPLAVPVRGVELQVYRAGETGGWNVVRTDAAGRFHYVPREGGPCDLRAQAPTTDWEDLAHDGVAPGTQALELRFRTARWLTVDVVDDGGRPLIDGAAGTLQATGPTAQPHWRGTSDFDGRGQVRLRIPGAAFRVRVTAPGFRDELIGPFEPLEHSERIVVAMTRVPALVGVVTLPGGAPAAGARVSLHNAARDSAGRPGYLGHQVWRGCGEAFTYALALTPVASVRADEEGRYRLPLPGVDARAAADDLAHPGVHFGALRTADTISWRLAASKPDARWYVHAACAGVATATRGPLTFEPTEDARVDLELPEGGAIAGRLQVDGPRRPDGWTVVASDGLAEVARADMAEDGEFRFEHLHPGRWRLAAFEPGQRFERDSARMVTEVPPVLDIEVVAGATTEVTHRARIRASARLTGQLSLDGAPPGAWRIDVRTTSGGANASYPAMLDPDGAFEVELPPGMATTVHAIGARGGAAWHVFGGVHIADGDNAWRCDLGTATLEVLGDPTERAQRYARFVLTQGEVTVRVEPKRTASGELAPFPVPAGRGRFEARESRYSDSPNLARDVELAPGAALQLDLR